MVPCIAAATHACSPLIMSARGICQFSGQAIKQSTANVPAQTGQEKGAAGLRVALNGGHDQSGTQRATCRPRLPSQACTPPSSHPGQPH